MQSFCHSSFVAQVSRLAFSIYISTIYARIILKIKILIGIAEKAKKQEEIAGVVM